MGADKQIQQALQRLTKAIKNPYLLADHLALARMGPLSLAAVKDNGVTYVDNPATHWVLESFQTRAPSNSGKSGSADKASQVLSELNKLNKGLDESVKKTQEAIGERIDKVSVPTTSSSVG